MTNALLAACVFCSGPPAGFWDPPAPAPTVKSSAPDPVARRLAALEARVAAFEPLIRPAPPAPADDLSALRARLGAAEAKLVASQKSLADALARVASLESRLAASNPPAPAPAPVRVRVLPAPAVRYRVYVVR